MRLIDVIFDHGHAKSQLRLSFFVMDSLKSTKRLKKVVFTFWEKINIDKIYKLSMNSHHWGPSTVNITFFQNQSMVQQISYLNAAVKQVKHFLLSSPIKSLSLPKNHCLTKKLTITTLSFDTL